MSDPSIPRSKHRDPHPNYDTSGPLKFLTPHHSVVLAREIWDGSECWHHIDGTYQNFNQLAADASRIASEYSDTPVQFTFAQIKEKMMAQWNGHLAMEEESFNKRNFRMSGCFVPLMHFPKGPKTYGYDISLMVSYGCIHWEKKPELKVIPEFPHVNRTKISLPTEGSTLVIKMIGGQHYPRAEVQYSTEKGGWVAHVYEGNDKDYPAGLICEQHNTSGSVRLPTETLLVADALGNEQVVTVQRYVEVTREDYSSAFFVTKVELGGVRADAKPWMD